MRWPRKSNLGRVARRERRALAEKIWPKSIAPSRAKIEAAAGSKAASV
jgi:hypothetical protein